MYRKVYLKVYLAEVILGFRSEFTSWFTLGSSQYFLYGGWLVVTLGLTIGLP